MRQRHAATTPIVAALVIGVLALAGCSAGGGATGGAGDVAEYPSVTVPDGGSESAPDEALDSASGEATESSADRQLVSEGTVSITAKDPIAAAAEAVGIVEAAGGRIDSLTESPATDDDDALASADLVVRIPATELTSTLNAVEELGDVEQAQLNQTDVTTETQDVSARITALITSTDRLTTLLASATSTKDLIEIESTLAGRQGELETLQAQQRGLTDQVRLATVAISFGSEATAPVESPDTFLSGLATGWESLVGFVGGILVALGVALPWLVILGAVAVAVLLVMRRRRPVTPVAATMEE